jgi:hypothetical protein
MTGESGFNSILPHSVQPGSEARLLSDPLQSSAKLRKQLNITQWPIAQDIQQSNRQTGRVLDCRDYRDCREMQEVRDCGLIRGTVPEVA